MYWANLYNKNKELNLMMYQKKSKFNMILN